MNDQQTNGRWLDAVRRQGPTAMGNLTLAVVSIALSVTVWVGVRLHNNPKEALVTPVRVQTRNVPPGYLVAAVVPDRADVRFLMSRSLLDEYKAADESEVTVDLSRGIADSFQGDSVTVDRQVRVNPGRRSGVSAEPITQTVSVTLERAKTKRVPVQVRRVGGLPTGYEEEKEKLHVEPAEAVVVGSAGNLQAVAFVTLDAKLDGLTVSLDQTNPLEARGRDDQLIGNVTVQPERGTVRIVVKQTQFRREMAVEARVRGQAKTGVRVTSITTDPPLVRVQGSLEQINSMLSVPTEPVDIEGADKDIKRLVRLDVPRGVLVEPQAVTVTVGLQVVSASAPLSVVPRPVGLAQGFTATISPPVVALNLTGPLGDLASLRPTDASVIVDVTGLRPGTHEVEAKVERVPATLQAESVTPGKVRVTITPFTSLP